MQSLQRHCRNGPYEAADPPQNQAKFGALFLHSVRKGAIGAGRMMSTACPLIGATRINCFAHAVALLVRALDHGLDLACWPLPQQQAEAAAKPCVSVDFTERLICARWTGSAGRCA